MNVEYIGDFILDINYKWLGDFLYMFLDLSNVMMLLLFVKFYKVKYGGVWKIWNFKIVEVLENLENLK